MANTSLRTNFNVDPWYDDFNEDKGFYRVLFKPRVAVQARELTQLQTIMQKQIERFGDHIFKEGSIVTGGEFNFDTEYAYLKIRNNDINGNPVNVLNLVDQTITDPNTGLRAIVVNVLDGDENTAEPKTLYVKYQNSGNNGEKTFSENTTLTSSNQIFVSTALQDATGFAMHFKIGRGVLFAKEHFVLFPEQEIILSRYSNTPTVRVGLEIEESIVDYLDDITLVDPANGSPNFAAPGADRLKLTATLVSTALDDLSNLDFRTLFTMEDGVIQTIVDKPQYSELAKELARRTYDESGNYTVDGLKVTVREHLNNGLNNGVYSANSGGNSSLIVAAVEPGKAYVQGFEYNNLTTKYIPTDKGIDFLNVEQQVISLNYGNYVYVNEVVGTWNSSNNAVVDLYNSPQTKVTSGTFSTTAPTGSKIGEAKIKAFVHESGNPGSANAIYRLYLNDIRMTGNADFASVRSFFVSNTAIGVTKASAFADSVLESNNTVLKEPNFNRNIFALPARFTRNLRDSNDNINTNYTFFKTFDVSIGTNGSFSVASTSNNEVFEVSGLFNNTLKREIFLTFHNAANVTLSGTASTTSGSNVLTGSGTQFTTQVAPGDLLRINAALNVTVASVTNNTSLVLTANAASSQSGSVQLLFNRGAVKNLSRPNAVVDAVSPTNLTVNLGLANTLSGSANASMTIKMNKIDRPEKKKTILKDRYVIINTSTHPAGVNGPWYLGFSDVLRVSEIRSHTTNFSSLSDGTVATNNFEFDNGQTDSLYEHGFIKRRPGVTLAAGTRLLVKLDVFQHDFSQGSGYFSVDSYPIDDVNPANTSAIMTKDIPVHVSRKTNVRYDLRDSLDFRPAEINTASTSQSIGSVTVNPARSGGYTSLAGNVDFPYPNTNFITDLSFYLPRRDLVLLDAMGIYTIRRGVPAVRPITPSDTTEAMTLAVLEIAPYPSLSMDEAIAINRPELGTRVVPIDNRRYTMRDIGVIDQRVKNLEYYVSVSLLEKETAALKITDENGLDRFKNGILVDSFTGHNVGAVSNPDYNISIDPQRRELRPRFNLENIPFKVDLASSNNVTMSTNDLRITVANSSLFPAGTTVFQGTTGSETAIGLVRYRVGNRLYIETTSGSFSSAATLRVSNTSTSAITELKRPNPGKLVSLPYTQRRYSSQLSATDARNAAGFFWNWRGSMTLSPDNDYWVDTVTIPPVRVNVDGNLDAWQQLANAWGTQWGSWQTQWTGSWQDQVVTQQGGRQEFNWITGTTQTVGAGTVTQTFTNTTTVESRVGTQLNVSATTVQQSLGSKVVDTSIIPWMRSRLIGATAVGLKPNTRFFCFFDDIDVTQFCAPATVDGGVYRAAGALGTPVVSDNNGTAHLVFNLPNNNNLRFNVGTKIFKVTDSPTNSSVQGSTLSSAIAQYTASGFVQTKQDTIMSTQRINLAVSTVSEQRTTTDRRLTDTRVVFPDPPPPVFIGSTGVIDNSGEGGNSRSNDAAYNDPIAQSLLIEVDQFGTQGIFITKAVFYFRKKHSFLPVTLEIRAMENGVITRKGVPYGKVTLFPADVNVSMDGSAPTPFIFETPVFLPNFEEFAFILKPEAANPDYEVFIARLGENDLITARPGTAQPHAGMVYASSNDRFYNAIQDETMKFEVYHATFGGIGTVNIVPDNIEFFNVANTSNAFITDELVVGTSNLTFTSVSNGPLVANTVIIGNTSNAQGTILSVSGNTAVVQPLNTDAFVAGETFSIQSAATSGTVQQFNQARAHVLKHDLDNSRLLLYKSQNTFSANGLIRGQLSNSTCRLQSADNYRYNVIQPEASFLTFTNTRMEFSQKSTSNTNVLATNFSDFAMGEELDFGSERLVLSRQNELALLGGQPSFQVRTRMITGNSFVSPIIDMQRYNAILVQNIINNDATGETNPTGGNALARYITRTVTLNEGLDAEDMKVFLGAARPFGTDIKVYYKILHREDSDRFVDRPWVEMTRNARRTFTSNQNFNDFTEFEYDIPETEKNNLGFVRYTNSNGTVFTTYKYFAIKIVLLSSDTSIVPRVKDLRVIALQR